jgi:hypothetical protein
VAVALVVLKQSREGRGSGTWRVTAINGHGLDFQSRGRLNRGNYRGLKRGVRADLHCTLNGGFEGGAAVDTGANGRRTLRRGGGSTVAARKNKGLTTGPHLSAGGEKR